MKLDGRYGKFYTSTFSPNHKFLAKLDYLSDIFLALSKKQTSGQHCICDIISAANHSTKQIGYQTLCIRVKGMVLMISTQPFPEYENTSLISSKECQLLFFPLSFFSLPNLQFFFFCFVSKWSNILTLNRKIRIISGSY